MKIERTIFAAIVVGLVSVGNTQLAVAGTIPGNTTTSTVIGAKVGMIPATSSIQDLEQALKKSYVGTYAIYGSLPEEKKQTLYSMVKQGGNIKDFRNQLIKVRLKR